jgi:hypothetical protein
MSTMSSRQQRSRAARAAKQRKDDSAAVQKLADRMGFLNVIRELQMLAFGRIGGESSVEWENLYRNLSRTVADQEQLRADNSGH